MPFWLANHKINHVFDNPFDTIHYALVIYGIFFLIKTSCQNMTPSVTINVLLNFKCAHVLGRFGHLLKIEIVTIEDVE